MLRRQPRTTLSSSSAASDVYKRQSAKNCKKKVGDIERVLIEEENTHEEGMLTGRLENNLLVHFKGCKEQIGTMADVKLVEEKGFYYMGEQIHG